MIRALLSSFLVGAFFAGSLSAECRAGSPAVAAATNGVITVKPMGGETYSAAFDAKSEAAYLMPLGETYYADLKAKLHVLAGESEFERLSRKAGELLAKQLEGRCLDYAGVTGNYTAISRDGKAISWQPHEPVPGAMTIDYLELVRVLEAAHGQPIEPPGLFIGECGPFTKGKLVGITLASAHLRILYAGGLQTHDVYVNACTKTGVSKGAVLVPTSERPTPDRWLNDLLPTIPGYRCAPGN